MTISEPRLRSLVRQAKKLQDSGKLSAAKQVYRQILAEAPDMAAAWAGLAELTANPVDKAQFYQKALALDPENGVAQTGLARLRGELISEPVVETAVAPLLPEPEPIMEMAVPDPPHEEDEDVLAVCYRHPNRETSLRCYTCGKPICTQCAVKTPVGYSCPDCIRDLRAGYYNATFFDYILAFVVTLLLSVVAAYFVGLLGFFVIFVSPVAGTLIGRIVFRAIRRRRGRWLPHLVAGTVALGALATAVLPVILYLLLAILTSPDQLQTLSESGGLLPLLLSGGGSLLWKGVFAFLAGGAAYYFIKV